MLKYFRRYKMVMLVAFGVFLMVAMLLPSGISRLRGNPNDRVVMTVAGRSVRVRDLALAAREREAAAELIGRIQDRSLFGLVGSSTEHWIFMTEAARSAGLLGHAPDGKAFADRLAVNFAQTMWQDALNQWFQAGAKGEAPNAEDLAGAARTGVTNLTSYVAARMRLTPDEMDLVLAKLGAIQRMQSLYLSSARLSEPALRFAAARDMLQVEVEYLTIPGDRLAGTFPEPDALTLAAHFAQYRDTKREESDLGVGYVLPPRAKIEWITLSRDEFLAAAYVSDIQVRAEYDSDPVRYGADRDAAETTIRASLRDASATAMVREAERVIRGELLRARNALAADGMFRRIPDGWAAPMYEAISEKIRQALVEENDEPEPRWLVDAALLKRPVVTRRESAWLYKADLAALPGIGEATVRVLGRPRPFADVVLSTREINPETDIPVQTRLPAIDLLARDPAGNEYIFTVLDARPESPADTVDDVRGTAAGDFLAIQGFRRLETELSQIERAAREHGLAGAGDIYKDIPSRDGSPLPPLTALTGRVSESFAPDVLSDKAIKEEILRRARALDPTRQTSDLPTSETVFALAAPKSRAVVVVRIARVQPATIERFRSTASGQAQTMAIRDLSEAVKGQPYPFDIEPLRERLGVVRTDGRTSEDEEDEGKGE
ncbi:MAG: hypothetical protein IT439_09835 [Phycisphaerales bacterium]|nr:hypothetical protein [Phycisphaerales bacterium]